MNRAEFMNQLAGMLGGISESERQEALNYYNDYFDDAGAENESKVIQELGSPGKVAAIIKSDLLGEEQNTGEYTERGYTNGDTKSSEDMPAVPGAEGESRQRTGYQVRETRNWSKIILVIIILVVTSPAWLGIGAGLLGVLIGLLGVILGVVVSIAAGAFSGVVAGIFAIGKGIITCFTQPALGVMSMGLGCVALALGVLLLLLFVWMIIKLFPACIRGIVNLCQKLIEKGRSKA